MNTLFYFYPHCFINVTLNEILIYDTQHFNYLYIDNINLTSEDKYTLSEGYILYRAELCEFISLCLSKDFGYYVEYDKVVPYMNTRNLRFVTSLEKEYKSLNRNLSSYTNSLLGSVTFLLNNTFTTGYPPLVYSQIGYPDKNDIDIDYNKRLEIVNSFHNLREIVLSGEIGEDVLKCFMEQAHEKNLVVRYRILAGTVSMIYIYALLETYESLYVELLVDKASDLMILRMESHKRLIIKALIQRAEDVSAFDNIPGIIYVPIFYNHKNKNLLSELIMTKEEILSIHKDIKGCLRSNHINENVFGCVSITPEGEVLCLDQKIGDIRNTDLSCLINKWIRSQSCMWFYSRRKKNSCKECALSVLCPSISIYEMQNIYCCPCKIKCDLS